MLSLDHICAGFGERTLFENAVAIVGPHDRIGLIGPNGSGKSTLLKIIAGILTPDKGSINRPNFIVTGYLPQEAVSTSGSILFNEAENAFDGILSVQRKLEEIQNLLSTMAPSDGEYQDTIDVMGELQHKLEDLDVYRMKSKIEKVLTGLGFRNSDFHRPTDEFSGGWQMRIALSKLLLKEPNILLLDEPTNHLDMDTLQWLEDYLKTYNGAVIAVSHDRTFLDNLTTRTFALDNGRFETYPGNYSFYEAEYRRRWDFLESQSRNQQRYVDRTQKFIERFRYKATKASQVQSRIKQLEKMEIVQTEANDIGINFRFNESHPSGRIVMELKNVCKSYGSIKLFENLNYRIERGDHIAVVGSNGTGKSTLARILAGTEEIDSGERSAGHNMSLSYFAQDLANELDPSKDVLGSAAEISGGETTLRLRTILGSFLFHGDDVFKKVSVLSGGEKSRLALVRMLLLQANFLVMDEPTNHLDMKSKNVLQEALLHFTGTYVIVSHDRAFLEPLVNKVLEIDSGILRIFLGTLSEYLEKKKKEHENSSQASVKKEEKGHDAGTGNSAWMLQREGKKAAAREMRRTRKEIEKIEKEIHELEKRKKEIETMLAAPDLYKDGEKTRSASLEYRKIRSDLEKGYSIWTALMQKLELIEKEEV